MWRKPTAWGQVLEVCFVNRLCLCIHCILARHPVEQQDLNYVQMKSKVALLLLLLLMLSPLEFVG